MGEIISLKYDFAFKYLFLNETVRRHFISDALGIPLEGIRSARLANTFLWKEYWKQKQGILDVVVELNDDSKVNIEMQIDMIARWDKRSLFYLAKLFTEGLLNKPLSGTGRMDDWIRLFNAMTEEELKMLEASTKNAGILEAIKEVRVMSLRKHLRLLYEARQKEIRDKAAREDYVRSEGRNEGLKEGRNEGEDRINRLYGSLISDKRFEDLERSIKDKEYREQLYKEYGIF